MNDRTTIRARLEQLGPEQVRLMLAQAALPSVWNLEIYAWLAEIEVADKSVRDAIDTHRWQEQSELAASGARASWIAAWAGIAAAVLAGIGIAVTLFH